MAKESDMKTNVYVKSTKDKDYKHPLPVAVSGDPDAVDRKLERMLRGMLINMSEDYYVDTSEVDAAIKKLRGGAR
jgi:hypothetical protein